MYVCPLCGLPGEKQKKRACCIACYRKKDREKYQTDPEKRARRNKHRREWELRRGKPARNAQLAERRRTNPAAREYEIKQNHRAKLRRFGMTVDDYQALLKLQDGVCAICKKPETTMKLGRVMQLAVDHDHNTGCVRGLLCCSCNRALGLFEDSAELLESAASYLKRQSQSHGLQEPPRQTSVPVESYRERLHIQD